MKDKEFKIKKKGRDKVVGQSVNRTDAIRKVTGRAIFGYDYATIAERTLDNVLHTKILRSPHAHAEIESIDTSKAESIDGVVKVFTYKDVPDVKFTTAGQPYPEPSPYDTKILNEKMRYLGEPVAIVAAESKYAARKAADKINVKYNKITPIFDAEESLKSNVNIHDDGNLVDEINVTVGDIEEGFKESDVIIEKEYATQPQKHIHLEPHASVAWIDASGRLIINTTNQVVFHTRRILARIFEKPEKDIRVHSFDIGGSFGDKQEVTTEHYAALVALETGRPAIVKFNRTEQFLLSRRRHSAKLKVKLGADKKGNLKAAHIDVISDTGAYGAHGVTVTSNMGTMTLPLYSKTCKNLRFTARVAYTNKPISGAFRGYGTIQGGFALECAIDELSNELRIDPVKLRIKNAIEKGMIDPFSEVLSEAGKIIPRRIASCGLTETLKEGSKIFDWTRRREYSGKGSKKKGVGVASGMKGSGVPGFELSSASIKLNEDGSIFVNIGGIGHGGGLESVITQIAAETVGINMDSVRVVTADTDNTPHSMGVYASSGTYVEGNAVRKACEELRGKIIKRAAKIMGEDPQELNINEGEIYLKENPEKSITVREVATDAVYGESDKIQLEGFGTAECITSPPPFSTHFVEVEVDENTGEVSIIKYLNLTDVGTPINPREVEGQIEGSIAQAIGFALFEEMKFNGEGRLMNSTLGTYIIPRSTDIPEIETKLVRTHEPTGPYGAKSVGEICIVPPAPAIANAIYNAIGVRVRDLPITRKKLRKAIKYNS